MPDRERGIKTPSRRTSVADQATLGHERAHGKTGTSPSMRRNLTLPSGESSSSSSGPQRTMTTRYGSTSTSSSLAGLGIAGGSRVIDGALASPRRISTTSQAPPSAFRRSQSPAPLAPTHEAYYSQTQPPTATTPRFRDRDVIAHSQGNTPRLDSLHLQPSLSRHRRNVSSTSGLFAPGSGPASPVGTAFKRLRHSASNIGLSFGKPDTYDDDARKDSDTEDDEPAQTANGTRVWYSSYVTIDWLHDAVSSSSLDSSTAQHLLISRSKSLHESVAFDMPPGNPYGARSQIHGTECKDG
jgi:chloride channel 3/4/5